jgi:molecular chaperone DnaK (HSP70)
MSLTNILPSLPRAALHFAQLSNLHSNKGVDVVLTRRVMEAQCEDLFTRMTRPMRQAALMAGVALEGEVSSQTYSNYTKPQ